MILNIRGTGGAGKSTIVRVVMERYLSKAPAFIDGRKQPVGYLLQGNPDPGQLIPLWVPGHYETACGGCDTITKPDEVFASVREHAHKGYHVLFEGIICQDDTRRTLELPKETGAKLVVFGLTTPLEQCLAGIQSRRDARGDTRPLNPKNTTDRATRVTKTLAKLKDAGVDVRKGSREEVLAAVLQELGL